MPRSSSRSFVDWDIKTEPEAIRRGIAAFETVDETDD